MIAAVIFVSAGHHNGDPGAVYNGRKEADETKKMRDMVVEHLKQKNHEFIPDMDNETASQHQARIKTGSGSVVIEFHFNAAVNTKATGTEAIVKNNATPNSIALAKELSEVTAKILGIKDRGVKTEAQTARGKIGIVNEAGAAVLLEICFISNRGDMAAYDMHKAQLAKAYADLAIKYDDLV